MGKTYNQMRLEEGFDKLLGEIEDMGGVELDLQYAREFENQGYELSKYITVLERLKKEDYVQKEIKDDLIRKTVSIN